MEEANSCIKVTKWLFILRVGFFWGPLKLNRSPKRSIFSKTTRGFFVETNKDLILTKLI